ncbi:hypothetical protein EP7_001398 [Isosphaeraceae bacterium EP7]
MFTPLGWQLLRASVSPWVAVKVVYVGLGRAISGEPFERETAVPLVGTAVSGLLVMQ